jgi:hypothetical protein
MNIEIYTLCHREAKIIPYFMRHYSQYGHVFMYEGHSTDGSAELAQSLGATIIPLDTNNTVNDEVFTDMKNNCWKQSKADWVIICDMDEFVYHPDMLNYLAGIEETIICPTTYEMITDVYPTTNGQIYDEVKWGFKSNPKYFMFKPTQLLGMNYGCGCHDAQPEGRVHIKRDSEIICMHMRCLSIEHIVNRNAYIASRLSEVNIKMGWGWHTRQDRKEVENYFNSHRGNLEKVV